MEVHSLLCYSLVAPFSKRSAAASSRRFSRASMNGVRPEVVYLITLLHES